jgi:enoyl-CoA hydratase
MENVLFEKNGSVCTIVLNRPDVKNAVDRETAGMLYDAFIAFERDEELAAAVLWGAGGSFCAGADLKNLAKLDSRISDELNLDMNQPAGMGPTRMTFSKPVIAAISGYAVAGGLELACMCDLRVMEEDAILGVFCRRFGVPLIDGGTIRLPRIVGMGRALDLILTGRPVDAQEALQMGLSNRIVEKGGAREAAEALAAEIAAFPRNCMLNDRKSVYAGFDLPFDAALMVEFQYGLQTIKSGETRQGGKNFSAGVGRHGEFAKPEKNEE